MRKTLCNVLVMFLLAAYIGVFPGGVQQVVAAETKPTVYICGDSTVQTYSSSYAPQAGWGQMISKYFTTDVLFVNKAIAGRSSKSFIADGRLDAIINIIKPNDYLFVQFGHNDATISNPDRYAEPNTTYKECLRQYIDRAREKSAIPVLITPVARLNYTNGVYKNDFPAYCTAMKEVAAEKSVPCIDLMSNSISYYNTLTYEKVYSLYLVSSNGTDYTHFTEAGATQIARIVAEGVLGLNLPISKYVINTSIVSTKPTNTPTNKPSPTSTAIPLSEDINGDKVVNMTDIMIIAASFNALTSDSNRKCDLNKDGAINMSDVMLVAIKFNTVLTSVSDIYQAEQAKFSLGVLETTNTGYTGNGYVNFDNVIGSYVEWTVNVPESGTYSLNFMYANGTTINRPMEIKVNNNVVINSMDFNSTDTWTTWNSTGIKASLNAGNNVIITTAITTNGGPNVDYLEISK